jgi:hypothetical protein
VLLRKLPFLLFLVPAALFADVVYLQGAGTITGKIVEQNAESVQVDVGGGIIGVPMSRVERIVKARCPLDDYLARAAKLAPTDTAGWLTLAEWASQNGLPMNAHDAYEKVLVTSPDDAAARQALGYTKLNGKWLTEDEAYQASGYVKHHGEWMTPAQAQVEQTSEAQDKARKDAQYAAVAAENRADEAEARAEKAEKEAKKAQEAQLDAYGNPINYGYYGGYAYGVTSWPTGTGPSLVRPSQMVPSRGGK